MGRSTSHSYDPTTGKWSSSTVGTRKDSGNSSGSSSNKSSGGSSTQSKSKDGRTPSPQRTSSNLVASTGDRESSRGNVEQKANTIEYNILEGQLQFIVTEETIKLRAGDTVTLRGLGKYLSGNYYVKSVSRNISRSGYSHSAVLIKTDFGTSLKSAGTVVEGGGGNGGVRGEIIVISTPQASTTPQKTYTVKKGDCLWNIAKKQYGAGSSWKKIYDANTGQVVDPNLIYPGQELVIP